MLDSSESGNIAVFTQQESDTVMPRYSAAKRPREFCIRNVTIPLVVLLLPACVSAQEMPQDLPIFLRDRIGLSAMALAHAKRGEVFGKFLRSEPQEVAVLGLVLVNAPADFFRVRFGDIE